MPETQAPNLRTITAPDKSRGKHYIVNFAFEFAMEVSSLGNMGPLSNLDGFLYTLDFSRVSSPAVLASMKSMAFSITFSSGLFLDGDLIIYVPETGAIYRIGAPILAPANDLEVQCVSGVIPMVTNTPPSTIQFFKQGNQGTHDLFGTLTVTFFDFVQPSWIHSGFVGAVT